MTKIFFGISDEIADKPHCPCDNDACQKVGRQYANVSLPVELTPKTKIGKIEAKCCGEPTVCCQTDDCSNTCKVVITQTICINIPIRYELTACTGECSIECCDCD
ncbi:MAG: hypothetical protein ACI396_07445 [Acutalibacteraceae bacterium]